MSYILDPIGIVHSCFTQKFGIPRQPGLASAATGRLVLLPPYNNPEAVAGLEGVSHLWIEFIFHEGYSGWKPRVKMPRLGGNKSLGVFATRSPNRPNNLGLSVVRLIKVELEPQVCLVLGGVDMLDGTPVVDIKPYLPYADAIENARNDWAAAPPALIRVHFSPEALAQLAVLNDQYPNIAELATQVLSQDPRPSYQDYTSARVYVLRLWDLDLHWRCLAAAAGFVIEVLFCRPVKAD